jgi:hypothetical protein
MLLCHGHFVAVHATESKYRYRAGINEPSKLHPANTGLLGVG